ncbi:MAG: trypsin-like peptidase domain-containing protein [Candidatus Poribacteria bacterium]|nr:trypsin-like peptidase domain-containing protein [Candidatus Poribacteria bacterium]
MKRLHFLISMLFLVTIPFLQSGFAQDYVHYKTLTGSNDDGWVECVTFSPDGQMLTSKNFNSIHLWNVGTGKHIRTFVFSETMWEVMPQNPTSFSLDGEMLAIGSLNGSIYLWDPTTSETILRGGVFYDKIGDALISKHLNTIVGHTEKVLGVAFSPDGRTLVSGGYDNIIHLWDVWTGKSKKTLTGHTRGVSTVAFSPDGKILASGSWDDTIRLWDVSSGKLQKTIITDHGGIRCVNFASDGLILASGGDFGSDNTVRLWDVKTGKHNTTLEGHTGSVTSIVFSPDGKTLASGSGDWTVRLWDVKTGKHNTTLTGHTSDVWTVAFSPDGSILASAGHDKTIRLWKLTSPHPPKTTANQIYNNAIRAVMWIVNPGIGEGSGVLLDKKSKLAITNAHVTGKQNTIDVYFPAPDEKGELIKDRNFYLTNGGVLKRLGYYTKGHVISRNEKTDLATIRLDGLPETAREIDWKLTPPATKAGELVYILGNPAKQDLWRWTLGEFLNDHQDFLHIQSDVFGGNSGGPVLNKQGILLGIVARSDQLMNAAAIPARHINQLLSESKVKHSRISR